MEVNKDYIPEICLIQMSSEKEKEYSSVIPYLYQTLDDYNKHADKKEELTYFLCTINGEEKLVQFIGRTCIIYYFNEDRSVVYSRFIEFGDDYEVEHATYDKYELFNHDGQLLFRNYGTGLLEDFDYTPTEQEDNFGYTGSAIFSQYNSQKDIKLYLVYPIVNRDNIKMYNYHLRKPQKYMFVDNASKVKKENATISKTRSYARYELTSDQTYLHFTLATIREFGLFRTLKNGPVALQKSDSITRYYRMGNADRNNNIRINFAFAEQLKEEDMELLMKEGGFLTEVPDHIIDSFNMENREYIEDCSLAEVIRQMDKGFIQEHGRSLVYANGAKNENS